MRMLTFYINRAGRNLPEERKKALERAKTILSGIIADQKERGAPKEPSKRSAAKKTPRRSAKKSAYKTTKTSHPRKKTAKKAA